MTAESYRKHSAQLARELGESALRAIKAGGSGSWSARMAATHAARALGHVPQRFATTERFSDQLLFNRSGDDRVWQHWMLENVHADSRELVDFH